MCFFSSWIWVYQPYGEKCFSNVYDTCGLFCLFFCVLVCGAADEDPSYAVICAQRYLDDFAGDSGTCVAGVKQEKVEIAFDKKNG